MSTNASIGKNSKIWHFSHIRKNLLIGAGSVVTKNIPKNIIAFGNPATEVRNRN